ncbi:MAG: Mbov_0395 family pilin-like conjugal transfer protein [Candidatus Saccharimonadales bacterium]
MKYLLSLLADNSFGLPQVTADGGEIQTILQIVFGIAGALALLMIIISGFRFITSAGSPQEVAKAKNGILYAVAGLAACILAEAIVTFVIGHV